MVTGIFQITFNKFESKTEVPVIPMEEMFFNPETGKLEVRKKNDSTQSGMTFTK